ncbi:hypothetical protein [Cellulosimicrobium sp. CUA-896]|uniref:hypothetical protein n=1 Tax=Cellulosimicrobium sp. CUA-896 TaxID=1517881 RepID=UPI002100EEB2|nr:hypothetical protein [Cellulosimicrobium sp. CUA-896]
MVLRPVHAGELVPAGALGAGEDLAVRAVAVPVASGLSDRIVAGAVVDLWHVPPAPGGAGTPGEPSAAEPVPLVQGVTVAQVDEEAGTFVAGGPVTVHVLVAEEDLPAVLGAVAGEGSIAVVPVGGTR